MNFSVELIIALIGAITGISSLFLQFFDYWKSRPQIELKLDNRKRNFYFFNNNETFETNSKYENSEITAVMPLLIRNQSIQPITIEKIEVTHPKVKYPVPINNKSLPNTISYHIGEGSGYVVLDLGNSLEFPKRIDGYDTLLGNIKLTFINKDMLDKNDLNITINLFTSKKVVKKDVTLKEFTYPDY